MTKKKKNFDVHLHVKLPQELKDRLMEKAGKNRTSDFIRKAIELKIAVDNVEK